MRHYAIIVGMCSFKGRGLFSANSLIQEWHVTLDLLMRVPVLQIACAMLCLCKITARRTITIYCVYVTSLLSRPTPFLYSPLTHSSEHDTLKQWCCKVGTRLRRSHNIKHHCLSVSCLLVNCLTGRLCTSNYLVLFRPVFTM